MTMDVVARILGSRVGVESLRYLALPVEDEADDEDEFSPKGVIGQDFVMVQKVQLGSKGPKALHKVEDSF